MEIHACYEYEPGGYYGDLMWYWTRGHVDKAEFVSAIDLEYEVQYNADEVQHVYVRNVPAGPDEPGVTLMHISKKGRGAYPATVLDIDLVAIHAAERRFAPQAA